MLLIDAHADTLYRMATEPGSTYDLSLERLLNGGVNLQVLALFCGTDPAPRAVADLIDRMLCARQALLKDGWVQTDDPFTAVLGKTSFMLSIEGCEPFEKGLEAIREYRQLGVRMASVTWNHENRLGTPACVNQEDGLKPFGLKAVREMQRLGIAVDVSHLNVPGFYDVLTESDAPPLASHSCCRALRDHPRNLTDRQLKDLFAQGGYVGVNFYPSFLVDDGNPCDIQSVIDHIDHMHQMGGAGMVGFGSDFDGIPSKPDGLDNPEDFPKLMDGLKRRGYGEKDVQDIAGLGFLRYYRRISV